MYMYVNFKKITCCWLIFNCLFCFLLDGLFYRIVNRTTKWCIDNSGKEPYCLLKTLARFFLDDEHDFVLEMAPRNFHKIKVHFTELCYKKLFLLTWPFFFSLPGLVFGYNGCFFFNDECYINFVDCSDES